MRTLKTSEAATMLRVSPSTLRSWESRFDYPRPLRSAGQHRRYTHAEIVALGNGLREGLSLHSAISHARESVGGFTDTLVEALTTFDEDAADFAMESALALRSFDSCVEDVLLRSLDEIAAQAGSSSVTWTLAAHWVDDWLRRAQRFAPPPRRPLTILVGDAGGRDISDDLLALRALQLFCDRAGLRVVVLPVRCVDGLENVRETLAPDAVVTAGSERSHEHAAAWAGHVAAAFGPLPHALFRCHALAADEPSADRWVLPDAPHAAHRDLLSRIEALASARAA